MSKTPSPNLAASVRQRLLNLSKFAGEPFDLVLTHYALERFLYRLSVSPYSDRFVLKGALLLAAWGQGSYRPTRDLDLLGYGDMSDLTTIFREICQIDAEPDGLTFDTENLRITEIREQEEYQGHRVQFVVSLAQARIPLQVDIAYGDVVTPEPKYIDYPVLLKYPPPRIRAYPIESMVSEKLQAMVVLGMANSRMKDFYDVWALSRKFNFDGQTLVKAITATFARRSTDISATLPVALSERFANDPEKIKQWRAFLSRSGLVDIEMTLPQLVDDLRDFLLVPIEAAAQKDLLDLNWTATDHWSR